ncbi:MAG: tyrosine-type recombinase/integrase [Pseudomonadota bacterium]
MTRITQSRRPSVVERLRWLEPHVALFEPWLRSKGYTPATIVELRRLLGVWAAWAQEAGFRVEDMDAALVASEAVFHGRRPKRAPRVTATLFAACLRDHGILAPVAGVRRPDEDWPILVEFDDWMRQQRGAQETTLCHYHSTLIDLLRALGDDPTTYSAAAVRAFVLERVRPHGRGRAQSIAVATRAFLRFLVATGRCPAGREMAVPSFASWGLASTPSFLTSDQIERVIAACEGENRLRDRAVVLLLARLGLRAGEVAGLTFPQIDWDAGLLRITGKTRREERVPLTQEVGDALLAYIERGRPKFATPRVFLTEAAPVGPVGRIAVKCLVRRALDRAGIDSPHRGAHVLRHSAASAMLAHGVSLAGVGAVLRHRSPSMTAHYAKVDFGLLREVAQPWGGRLPC